MLGFPQSLPSFVVVVQPPTDDENDDDDEDEHLERRSFV
jgi:hypothetical protein